MFKVDMYLGRNTAITVRLFSQVFLLVMLTACSQSLEHLISKTPYSAVAPYSVATDMKPGQNMLDQPYVMATYGQQYRVSPHETLYSIARANKVSLRDIIDLNKIKAPFIVRSGQIIKLPQAGTHVVKPGDTIYSLSRKYRVTLNSLTNINNISKPYRIRVGEVLQIPLASLATAHQAATARPTTPTLPPYGSIQKATLVQPSLRRPRSQSESWMGLPKLATPDRLRKLPPLPSKQMVQVYGVPLPQPRPAILAQKTIQKQFQHRPLYQKLSFFGLFVMAMLSPFLAKNALALKAMVLIFLGYKDLRCGLLKMG